MTKMRRAGLIVILLSSGISIWWGCALGWSMPGGPLDFQAVYYGSRTLLQHHDPYRVAELDSVYQAESSYANAVTPKQHVLITLFVNTPATLQFVAPFALLPLFWAQVLWMFLTTGSLVIAAYLMWELTAESEPVVSAFLIGFLLLNCEVIFAAGNTAAIVVGLCAIAAWCFVKSRLVPLGIVCMAVSLVIKPHDAGLVWLYFLLANSVQRKRAIQTAALAVLFAVPAFLWISSVVPTWMHDWQANLTLISAPGGMNDPRPGIVGGINAGNVISLQAVFSVFNQNARFYNLASYLVCGIPIVWWCVVTLRSEFSPKRAWFALAAITPLTMLVTYHRVYDAKLLLLTIPACAMLWSKRGLAGKAALILTAAGVVLNADIPLAILDNMASGLNLTVTTWTGKLLTISLARPNQLVLAAMSIFYLWVYRRCLLANGQSSGDGICEREPARA